MIQESRLEFHPHSKKGLNLDDLSKSGIPMENDQVMFPHTTRVN